jgi:hypothetical protein
MCAAATASITSSAPLDCSRGRSGGHGEHRFAAALARLGYPDEVDVVWRSGELNPATPRVTY